MPGCLILEDGTCFNGTRFGSPTPLVGEIALYTAVVGWQEVLTDPAYAGKIVVFTYPHVGNYGVNHEDVESSQVTVKGIVVRDLARFHSNFRATGDFRSWVEEKGITGLNGLDTRAVMVHARDHGAGTCCIAGSPEEAQRAMRECGSPFNRNLVAEVQGICRAPGTRGGGDAEMGRGHALWHVHRGEGEIATPSPTAVGEGRGEGALNPVTRASAASRLSQRERELAGLSLDLAVLDLGGKYSLYRQFAELGCSLRFFPWDASAETIIASGPAGLLLPPGPGDPNRLGTVVTQVGRLLGKLPILGIGLGFQLLALALGARVSRLKLGRHGVNYPVRSTRGEPSLIAACHHSFAVEGSSLPPAATITYTHLNDGTPMGLEAAGLRAWGYQFHPSRDGDNRPSPLLARFVNTLRKEGEN